jgi:hypothetical protein
MTFAAPEASAVFKGPDRTEEKGIIIFDDGSPAFGTNRLWGVPKGIP